MPSLQTIYLHRPPTQCLLTRHANTAAGVGHGKGIVADEAILEASLAA